MAKSRSIAEVRLLDRERHRKAGVPAVPAPMSAPAPSARPRMRLRPDVTPSASIRSLALAPALEVQLVAAGVGTLAELAGVAVRDELGWIVSQRDEAAVRRAFGWYLVPETGEGGR